MKVSAVLFSICCLILAGFAGAASSSAASAYAYTLQCGQNLTIQGTFSNLTGLVNDAVPASCTKPTSVYVTTSTLTNVRAIVYSKTAGGAISVKLGGVHATGLGDGVHCVCSVDVEWSTLLGGGLPPAGDPAGIHSLDDAAGNVAVPSDTVTVSHSTITGFTSTSGAFPQGDSVLGETRVSYMHVSYSTLGHNSDSGGVDSKAAVVEVDHNTIYSDSDRAISSHYGTLTSHDNTIYQAAGDHNKVYQGSGTLNAHDDVVTMTTGFLAYGNAVCCPGSGPASTYPRVGHLTLTNITAPDGTVLTGPTHAEGGATVTVTPPAAQFASARRTTTVYDYTATGNHTSGTWTTGPNFTFHVQCISGCSTLCYSLDVVSDSLGRDWWHPGPCDGSAHSKLSAAAQSWHYVLHDDVPTMKVHVWVTE